MVKMKRSYTILYADDDKDDLLIISEAFEKYTDHLRVVHAYHGAQALDLLQTMNELSTLPCLIILDINMPIMDGLEALRQIKKVKDYSDIPVVMFSTSTRLADKKAALDLGAEYISKPNSYKDLQKLVDTFAQKCLIEARE